MTEVRFRFLLDNMVYSTFAEVNTATKEVTINGVYSWLGDTNSTPALKEAQWLLIQHVNKGTHLVTF